MPPWRWTSAIIAGCCIAVSWAFATNDAPFSKLESEAAVLYLATGILLGTGAVLVNRRVFLSGIAGGLLTFAFRAWEISVVPNGASFQARLTGACIYLMLFVLTLGLGLAFVRWEAQGGRIGSH